jgi:hypothetical protein
MIKINPWWKEISACGKVSIVIFSAICIGFMVGPIYWMITELNNNDNVLYMTISTIVAILSIGVFSALMCYFCGIIYTC